MTLTPEIIDNIKTISSSTKELTSAVQVFINHENGKPFYNEYQDFLGALTGAFIPIAFSLYLIRKEKVNTEKEYCDMIVALINKEINSIENYKENIKRQVSMLLSQKTTNNTKEETFVVKFVPVLVNNYSGFRIESFNKIQSAFIAQQLVFCNNDSENFTYNSKLMSSQIENLFQTNEKMIDLAIKTNVENSKTKIKPEDIKTQFDTGVDQLVTAFSYVQTNLEKHKVDLIVLSSSISEYKKLGFGFIKRWNLKFGLKYRFLPWNIFNRKKVDVMTFDVLYSHFKEIGLKSIKEIARQK